MTRRSDKLRALASLAKLSIRHLLITWVGIFCLAIFIFIVFFLLETSDVRKDFRFDGPLFKLFSLAAPAFFSICLPYSWLLSLTFLLWRTGRSGFFAFNNFRKYTFFVPLGVAFFSSTLLSLAMSRIPVVRVQEFDAQLLEMAKQDQGFLVSRVIKPFEFQFFQNYAVFITERSPLAGSPARAFVYRLDRGVVTFVGRGTLVFSTAGSLCLQALDGVEIEASGISGKISRLQKPLCFALNTSDYRERMESAARIRQFVASPKLPLSLRADKTAYPFANELMEIEKYSRVLLAFSPFGFFLLFAFFAAVIRFLHGQITSMYSICFFGQGLSLLIVPYLPEIGWFAKPSFAVYYIYFLCLMLSLLLFLFILTGRIYEIISYPWRKLGDFIFYLSQASLGMASAIKTERVFISRLVGAQVRFLALVLKRFCLAFFAVALVILALLLLQRFAFSFQINRGIEAPVKFLLIQFSDLLYDILWWSPFVLMAITPWVLRTLIREGSLLRLDLSGKGSAILRRTSLIVSIAIILGSLFLLENYALNLKGRAQTNYENLIGEENAVGNTVGFFFKLPQNRILYYRQSTVRQNGLFTEMNVVDDLENSGKIYVANHGVPKEDSIKLIEATPMDLRNLKTTPNFSRTADISFAATPQTIRSIRNNGSGQLGVMDMLEAIRYGIYANSYELMLLKSRLFTRLCPYIAALILIFPLIYLVMAWPRVLEKRLTVFGLSSLFPLVIQLILYVGLDVILATG